MATYNKNSKNLTLAFSLLCLMSFTHAADNDRLIKSMCGATYAPNVCISCVKSNSKDATFAKDVIQQMLECLISDATRLKKDVDRIINTSQFSSSNTTRAALVNSQPYIEGLIAASQKGQNLVGLRKYDDARSTIKDKIFNYVHHINSEFRSSTNIIPPPVVFSGMFKVEADYKISSQLINFTKA